jgi:hypothetical protein
MGSESEMIPSKRKGWLSHGWLGLALIGIFWPLNWLLPGARTQWGFFPLWLGYCLVVDALVYKRKGNSLLTRNPKGYAKLFLFSVPGWWLFELLNLRTQNWFYDGGELFSPLQFFLLSSLSFSTVIPAVFGTAELVGTLGLLKRLRQGLVIPLKKSTLIAFFSLGWLMLILLLIWPEYCFPFLWLAAYFIIEPLNVWWKNRSLAESTAEGDWRPVMALWLGGLICGFFWELWNYFSYPKWIYHVPFVGFWHIFEMPLLGYGGYLPFAMELLALYQILVRIFRQKGMREFIRLVEGREAVGCVRKPAPEGRAGERAH